MSVDRGVQMRQASAEQASAEQARIQRRAVALWIASALLALGVAPFSHSSSSANRDTVEVVQTSADLSQRLTRLPNMRFGTSRLRAVPVIHVDDTVRYQRIDGFGAAMTDTSAWLLYTKLSPTVRDAVMSNLFGAAGIRLNFVRVPMGASDFTKDGTPYSYDDLPPGQSDPSLARFSIAHDEPYILPALRQMIAINPSTEILANPWSPPPWMKTNQAFGNGRQSARLRTDAYGPLSRYFAKFIQAYAKAGVPVGAITPQNEPEVGSRYPGMTFPMTDEAKFIVQNLVPALRTAGLHTKVYGYDFHWLDGSDARTLLSQPAVARSVAGIAWHCYAGTPTSMTTVHDRLPQLDQLETECSSGKPLRPQSELLIASTRNWAKGVLLWNLAQDPSGGPVQPGGCQACRGVLTVDERTGLVRYRTDYYQLGQASSFIQRGARRISTDHFVSYYPIGPYANGDYATPGLDDVAFENPDRSEVLLAYNNGAQSVRFAVDWHGRWLRYSLAGGATVTFVWNRPKPG